MASTGGRGKGRGKTSKRFVSGSSQLVALSVSSGNVSSVAKRATFKPNAPNPDGLSKLCPVVEPKCSSGPLAFKAREPVFNPNVNILDV